MEQPFPELIGRPLLSPSGRTTGVITDACIKDGIIRSLTVARTVRISSTQKVICTERGVTVTSAKPIAPPPVRPPVEVTFCDEPTPPQAAPSDGRLPPRVLADYSFLLGRRVLRDVTVAGNTVVRQGEIILCEVVERAFRHGALFALTVQSAGTPPRTR